MDCLSFEGYVQYIADLANSCLQPNEKLLDCPLRTCTERLSTTDTVSQAFANAIMTFTGNCACFTESGCILTGQSIHPDTKIAGFTTLCNSVIHYAKIGASESDLTTNDIKIIYSDEIIAKGLRPGY